MGQKFQETTLSTNSIFRGNIIELQIDDVSLPNGKTSTREIVKHPGAVAIMAITENKKIIMVEQYRKPLEKSILEIPAGKLEPGEQPAITAKRELEEETGYTTDQLEYVTSFYTSPGFSDELMYLYFTDQLAPVTESSQLDEDEFVEVKHISLAEADSLIQQQEIHDAKTILALSYLKERFSK
ncbi:methanol dehydrogenase activator [Paraliobacillus ryukyuensis]|uniref:ADP-ribose pyrophosphatase n=1 Tax=Paraliobacillus ryukyuensis TaxID=200904 RepID=A0A366EGL5_9BACI|nr:NUDIX hydrolase [Paraliobacillus ryukyuensis]RBP01473.1 ADP-ribose pyrophosphatase [Paraliobacillus ryukyuensis]